METPTHVTVSKRPLTPSEATRVWREALDDLAKVVVRTLWKMRLPGSEESKGRDAKKQTSEPQEAAGHPLPDSPAVAEELSARPRTLHHTGGAWGVRRRLVDDGGLHEDIIQEVAEAFFTNAVPRGMVWADNARGWLGTVARRTTWRLGSERASEYLPEVVVRDGRGADSARARSPLDSLRSDDDVESLVVDRERRAALALLLRDLSEEDAEILSAKLDGSFDRLAAKLGTTGGALRVRAHRLCKELRERASERDPWESQELDDDGEED